MRSSGPENRPQSPSSSEPDQCDVKSPSTISEEHQLIDTVNQSQLRSLKTQSFYSLSVEEAMMQYETKDIIVKVHKPEKIVKAMESYVNFTINTLTTRDEFEKQEYCVKRRYNDFLWLRNDLLGKHPTLFIPPLPEKQSLTVDRFARDFVRYRQEALNRFLSKLCEHPILSSEKSLRLFLTVDASVFRRQCKSSGTILTHFSDSVHQLKSAYKSTPSLSRNAAEFERISDYLDKFSDHMSSLLKLSSRLQSMQIGYVDCLQKCSASYSCWAANDSHDTDVILVMKEVYSTLADSCQMVADSMTLEVSLPIKEYILFTDVVKLALTRRESLVSDVQILPNHKTKHIKSTTIMASSQQSSFGASACLENSGGQRLKEDEVNESPVEYEERIDDTLEVARASLNADLDRWNVVKKSDMKEMIGNIALRNISMYEQQIQVLEDTLSLLRDWKNRSS